MKEKILRHLMNNRERFISGQALSQEMGTSRTAVWKHIKVLKEEGYEIASVPNKGYKLMKSPDILSQEEVLPLLKTDFMGKKIIYMDVVSSTIDIAKEIAPAEKEGTAVIAEKQERGRGRMGRPWISPPRTGIWMSLILKPNIRPDKAYPITQAAAVAAARAIEEVTSLKAGVKWPNDIVVNGKKVCGILTEMSAEPDRINYIILSMGINVNTCLEDMPEGLRGKATSIRVEQGDKVSRKILVASLLNNFEKVYCDFAQKGFKAVLEDCRRYSVLLGKEIMITQMNETYKGKALDIREDGVLLVQTSENVVEAISGDVSVRSGNVYL